MNVVLIDSNPDFLRLMSRYVKGIKELSRLVSFTDCSTALTYICKHDVNLVFMEVEIGSECGIDLATKIALINNKTRIFFVTNNPYFALEAFRAGAIGYFLKDSVCDIMDEIAQRVNYISVGYKRKEVVVQTFGGFDLFVNRAVVHFPRKSAKEVLAVLVDSRGSSLSQREIAAIMWEDRPFDKSLRENMKKALQTLRKVLEDHGIEDILIRSGNFRAIDIEKISCDYYRFLDGEEKAFRQYRGNYMSCYAWAEETNAELYEQKYL